MKIIRLKFNDKVFSSIMCIQDHSMSWKSVCVWGGGGGGRGGAQSNYPTRDHQNIFNLIRGGGGWGGVGARLRPHVPYRRYDYGYHNGICIMVYTIMVYAYLP